MGSFFVYLWIMCVGYLTFGANSAGDILRNYSDKDPGATVARIAISIAVIFGFPLSFTALRDSTLSVFNLWNERVKYHLPVTFVLLSAIYVVAFFLNDLGLVNSLGGAIFGSLICLVFPGLLAWFAFKRYGKAFSRLEANINMGLV